MKPNTKRILTAIIAAGLSLSVTPRVISHEDDNDDDHERGGQVEGHERLEQKAKLTATADAPAGAKGKAELKATNINGVSDAMLKLEIEGLADGTYTVTVASLADATVTTLLGSFDVVTGGSDPEDDGDGDGEGEDQHDQASRASQDDGSDDDSGGGHHGDEGVSVVFGGADGIAFPVGFNPLDIGAVTIADANGVVLLSGSFDSAPNSAFKAVVQVQGGVDDPDANGMVVVKARVKKNVLTQRFALVAHGLPAKVPVTVTFNGTQTINTHTTRKGNLAVTRLPKGVTGHRLTSVEISGENGEHLGKAHF